MVEIMGYQVFCLFALVSTFFQLFKVLGMYNFERHVHLVAGDQTWAEVLPYFQVITY